MGPAAAWNPLKLCSRITLLSIAFLPPFALASPAARDAIDLPQNYVSGQLSAPLAGGPHPVLPPSIPLGSSPAPSCESSTRDLCYDPAQRRAVYRPARAYMPGVEGLTAESVSLRHGVVTFRYSFK
jgi:hypothetical protein